MAALETAPPNPDKKIPSGNNYFWIVSPEKKWTSWLRNADPPQSGQNLHEMGRHKCSWALKGGILHRISLRIFLDRSRPLNLNFFIP